MTVEAGLIILLGMLIVTLDFKVWAKIDRVVGLMLREREDILARLASIIDRIEDLEKRISK